MAYFKWMTSSGDIDGGNLATIKTVIVTSSVAGGGGDFLVGGAAGTRVAELLNGTVSCSNTIETGKLIADYVTITNAEIGLLIE